MHASAASESVRDDRSIATSVGRCSAPASLKRNETSKYSTDRVDGDMVADLHFRRRSRCRSSVSASLMGTNRSRSAPSRSPNGVAPVFGGLMSRSAFASTESRFLAGSPAPIPRKGCIRSLDLATDATATVMPKMASHVATRTMTLRVRPLIEQPFVSAQTPAVVTPTRLRRSLVGRRCTPVATPRSHENAAPPAGSWQSP